MASSDPFQLWAVLGRPELAGPSGLNDPVWARARQYAYGTNWLQQARCRPMFDYWPNAGPGPSPAEIMEPFWSPVLELERSDVSSVARFAHRIEDAAFHLCVAFEKAGVQDVKLTSPQTLVQPSQSISPWYAKLVNETFNRYRDLRNALVHPWTPPAEVEPLIVRVFFTLCDLTPAESQLRASFVVNQSRALEELARYLDIVADQLKATIQLAANLEPVRAADKSVDRAAELDSVQADILRKAGELLTLTSAASLLGVTRQALHKRIQIGTALGLMRGDELIVPATQFVRHGDRWQVVRGLGEVVALFDKAGAGRWSALQFLTEIDPLLTAEPIGVLKRGEKQAVVVAARGYLGLDEA